MNEDINLIIDTDSLNEIKGILALFLKESDTSSESSTGASNRSMGISMTNLASHVRESVNRAARNHVSSLTHLCQQKY